MHYSILFKFFFILQESLDLFGLTRQTKFSGAIPLPDSSTTRPWKFTLPKDRRAFFLSIAINPFSSLASDHHYFIFIFSLVFLIYLYIYILIVFILVFLSFSSFLCPKELLGVRPFLAFNVVNWTMESIQCISFASLQIRNFK